MKHPTSDLTFQDEHVRTEIIVPGLYYMGKAPGESRVTDVSVRLSVQIFGSKVDGYGTIHFRIVRVDVVVQLLHLNESE